MMYFQRTSDRKKILERLGRKNWRKKLEISMACLKLLHFNISENLQYLKLGDNKLNVIPSDALRRLHRLRQLDLQSNNITFIHDDTFEGYGSTISFLNIQSNS